MICLRECYLKFFLITSNLNSYRTTDIKPEMELHMMYKIYAVLPMRKQTEKTTFSCKDDQCNLTFILEWGQGTCSLTRHIRRWSYFRYFPLHAAYSALQHFLTLNCSWITRACQYPHLKKLEQLVVTSNIHKIHNHCILQYMQSLYPAIYAIIVSCNICNHCIL